MTIREKSLLIQGLTLVMLVAASQFITDRFLTEHFSDLSLQCAQHDVERFRNTVLAEVNAINAVNDDWAGWDSTYTFVQDGNTTFASENLVSSTFTALSLNLMAFLRTDGTLVWGQGFDLEKKVPVPLSPCIQSLIQEQRSPLVCTNDDMVVKGLIHLNDRTVMVSCRPILTSSNKGPSHGTLIMGRYLDDNVVFRLAKLNGLSISMGPFNQDVPGHEAPIRCSLPEDPDSTCLRFKDVGDCITRTFLRDIRGRACAVIQLQHEDWIHQTGRLVSARFALALLISGLVIGFTGFLALERLVLRRLLLLSNRARTIGRNEGGAPRLPSEGRDEVSSLATEINRLLDRLAQSQEDLRLLNAQLEQRVEDRTRALREESERRGESESRYSALVESQRDFISRWRPDTTFTFVNSALAQFFLRSPSDLIGQRWLSMAPPSVQERNAAVIQDLLVNPHTWTAEAELRSGDGQTRIIQWVSTPIQDAHNQVVEFQSLGRDVTEERAITRHLEASRAEIQRLYRHLDELRETEQRMLAERLHDEVGQTATVLRMDAEWAIKQVAHPTEEQRRRLHEMTATIDSLTKTIQEIAMDLRPSMLDHFGLPVALQWFSRKFCERSDLHCELDVDESLSMDSRTSTTLFRIAQELLTNIVRHASAHNIKVRLQAQGNRLCLEVEDDGRGITEASIQNPSSFGLTVIRERATGLGGNVLISRGSCGGTRITVHVPLKH